MFRPAILDSFRNYSFSDLNKDILAGLIVGVVALPLAIAFAIASGVSPERGIITAVIAGFIISLLGGSKVQIGGPTGAFIVIVYGIVQQYGIDGLVMATFMAGIMLILMGVAKLGVVIRFIPYPLVVGFTSGIAVVILSSQLKDFFGLQMAALPADVIGKWESFLLHFSSINWYAFSIAGFTVLIVFLWPGLTRKVPGSLVAIVVTTVIVQAFHLPVETIGSRFPSIPSALPAPVFPSIGIAEIRQLTGPAFTIAMLGGIESLLSAMVADGMKGGRHRSDTELIAQGTANIFSAAFGGMPATGAIARTATNIRNGATTPVAGIVHAITLLLIILAASRYAALIPMAALAGILVTIAYNMSEWQNFRTIVKGARSDMAVLLTTCILTILVDLTVAVGTGLLLAVFLFLRKLIRSSNIRLLSSNDDLEDTGHEEKYRIPEGVEVFEITGPLFFGAAFKFKDALGVAGKAPRLLILRMGKVPVIDATGIQAIREVYHENKKHGTRLILSEVNNEQVRNELRKARLLFAIGKANVTGSFDQALERCRRLQSDNVLRTG